MPDLSDFGGLGGISGAAGGLGALASLAGSGGRSHGGGGGLGNLGGLGAMGLLAGMAGGAAAGGGRRNNHHHRNHYCGGGGYHHGHGGHGGFGGGGGFGHHGVGGGYHYGPGGFGVGLGGMGMGIGGGYGMRGRGGYRGYGGGHHGYRGSAMRLPWMGVLAATAVASGAAAAYPRGARSQVTWKEGSKQVSAQVGGLTVKVACAQNLKSVSTMSTQDPYVKAKLLVDGYQISEVKSGTHNNGGRNPSWAGRNNFFTFYVPSNVPLRKLAVVLEIYDYNTMSADKMIGTCGKIPLQGIADGKMRWWTVTSGGQLQASVFSDVKFNSTKASKSGGQKQHQKKNKKKKKKKTKTKTKYHYGGGGGGGSRNEYNNYVNGMNNAGRNHEVLPYEAWANGRYRDNRRRESSSSSSSSSSDSDSDYGHGRKHQYGGGGRQHGYGDNRGHTNYAAPAGSNAGYVPPTAPSPYTYGAGGTPANFQSPDYRPPATAPSAPPAYPATAYPPAASAPGQPQAPPPYPGATAPQQGGVYYNQHANKR